MPSATVLQKLSSRLDSWTSALTGLGGTKDKRNSYALKQISPLYFTICEQLFNTSYLAARICEKYPQDALAEGTRVRLRMGQADDTTEYGRLVAKRWRELSIDSRVTEAAVWARVAGDAFLLVEVDDGLALDLPLDPTRIREIKALRVIERSYLSIASYYTDTATAAFGEPEIYTITPNAIDGTQPSPGSIGPGANMIAGVRVHTSRFIKFVGARTTRRQYVALGRWHLSILQRVIEVIRDYDISWDATAMLMQNASQGVYKVKDLISILASDAGRTQLESRMELIDMARSVARALVIDADTEEFTYQAPALTAIPDLLDRINVRLSSAVDMPVAELMGEVAGGIADTGNATSRVWNRKLRAYFNAQLSPQMHEIAKLIVIEQKIPADIEICVEQKPLEQPTDLETAQLHLTQAQADALNVTNQIVQPEEIAVNRFGPKGYSLDTVVDTETRETILDEIAKDPLDAADVQNPVEPNANVDPAQGEDPAAKGAKPDTTEAGTTKPRRVPG